MNKKKNTYIQDSYSEDGVDVKEGDSFSSFAGSICRSSYKNSKFVDVLDVSSGHFRGPRVFSFKNLPEGYAMDASPDGIGTKVVIIDAAFSHRQASKDVIAMTGGDITRYGGLPLVFVNVLDVASLGAEEDSTNKSFREMMEGLGEVAREQDIVVIKGETAELGVCVGSENKDATAKFNWAGVMIGVYHQDTLITGNTLKAGQRVIALREYGFRSNGMSSVRKAFQKKFGDAWWSNVDAKDHIKKAAYPSTIYDKLLATLNGWFSETFVPEVKVHGIAHITGGGVVSKFGHDLLFSRGFSAELDNLWEPPEIMRNCAEWREVQDREFYEMWNGGQGVLLVVDTEDCDKVLTKAHEFGVEAKVAGVITKNENPTLRIYSKLEEKEVVYKK